MVRKLPYNKETELHERGPTRNQSWLAGNNGNRSLFCENNFKLTIAYEKTDSLSENAGQDAWFFCAYAFVLLVATVILFVR